ncbi:MAG TPA: GTPase [archaeon]|nr:GTPase [archaeon]
MKGRGRLERRELFAQIVEGVVRASDVVLEVTDARFPKQTRSEELEGRIQGFGKKVIVVMNKSDLVKEKEALKKLVLELKAKGREAVFTSCKEFTGLSSLKSLLFKHAKESGRDLKVGVIGMPNTGKSSLVNRLGLRKAARVGPVAGTTVGKQWIRIANNILLLDTPGVFGRTQRGALLVSGGLNPEDLRDPETAAAKLIKYLQENHNTKWIKEEYGIENASGDPEKVIEEIAVKRKKLVKGGAPDVKIMSQMIVRDWQRQGRTRK